MRAALLESANTPLALVDDLDVAEPGAGLVRVHVQHCGLCHSDLTIIESHAPAQMPIVLGPRRRASSKRSGPVAVGQAGDHVVLVALAPCGRCYWCVRGEHTICSSARTFMTGLLPDGTSALSRQGQLVYRGLGVGGFAERVVTTESGVVRIDDDVPLDLAAVVGCSLQQGRRRINTPSGRGRDRSRDGVGASGSRRARRTYRRASRIVCRIQQ